ncbi:MAG TPA: hypothetical protein VIY48_07285 [Candidatus Paceibacterota bacterium]
MRYEVEITEASKRGGVYATPDKVTFRGPITLDGETWEWLVRDVHIYNVREIEWLK